MKIIDVSYHNGAIDFSKVKESGIDGVIIRAGYGQGNTDKKFREYIKACNKIGLPVGIYWFSYAYTVDMAKKEADYCINLIKDYKVSLPVFFDWEYDSMRYANERKVYPNRTLITRMNQAFCKKVQKAGYKAGYYYNNDYGLKYFDFSQLSGFYSWYARYTSATQDKCDIWQYSEKGKVSGISGNVDMNKVINTKIFDTTKKTNVIKDAISKVTSTKVSDTKMPTIKEGSKGRVVKIWQIIVGVDADGIFGEKTKKATKSFQSVHGLDTDGVVGKKTWKKGLESIK